MKKLLFIIFALAIFFISSGCHSVDVNGGEEAVLIEHPWFFGHGGVDETPVKSGMEWVAWSTSSKIFPIVPVAHKEEFDQMITSDNNAVNFELYIPLQIQSGKTPELYQKFNEQWYENNIQPVARTLIRDQISKYKLFELIGNRATLESIQNLLQSEIEKYCSTNGMPVMVGTVSMGKIEPPAAFIEQTEQTAIQNQSKLTQSSRAEAELARAFAEKNRALADRAYKENMNLTNGEYLALRDIEVRKEQVELIKDKQGISVILSSQAIPTTYPVK